MMQQVASDQLADFAAIYDEDVEIVSVTRPKAGTLDAAAKRLVSSRQAPQLRWVQAANASVPADAVPSSIEVDVRAVLLDEITEASEVLSELMGCEQVGIRLETLNGPMCPRFHVDHVPCRMLITLSGYGTEWIAHGDVDWELFADRDNQAAPVKAQRPVQQLSSGHWSLLKGGAWSDHFSGVVHRSPHGDGERLLLALDPIV